jgi:hypothetical protein
MSYVVERYKSVGRDGETGLRVRLWIAIKPSWPRVDYSFAINSRDIGVFALCTGSGTGESDILRNKQLPTDFVREGGSPHVMRSTNFGMYAFSWRS